MIFTILYREDASVEVIIGKILNYLIYNYLPHEASDISSKHRNTSQKKRYFNLTCLLKL